MFKSFHYQKQKTKLDITISANKGTCTRERAILSCVGGRFTEKCLLQLGLVDDVSLVVTEERGVGRRSWKSLLTSEGSSCEG